jgi:E3 ubiquitin-protein ligase RNF144
VVSVSLFSRRLHVLLDIAIKHLATTALLLSMDPASAKVATELQIADINGLFDCLYDDAEIPHGDARTSFQMLRQDLQRQLQIFESQVLVLKILKEEYDGRASFSRLLEEERQAVEDHKLAAQLGNPAANNPDAQQCAEDEADLSDAPECCSDEQWDMARELYAATSERHLADQAALDGTQTVEAGSANGTTRILGSEALTKCCACMEVVSSKNTLTLDCKPEAHTYCRTCLVDLFTTALSNTSLFPPRCCKVPVPLDTCRVILPKALVKSFDLKVEELATPNPTYCSNGECSKFIRPKDIKADVGSCVFCKQETCLRCKGSQHAGLCPSDPHVQLLMDVARRSRWQQCTQCNNMVELEQGCFHMT